MLSVVPYLYLAVLDDLIFPRTAEHMRLARFMLRRDHVLSGRDKPRDCPSPAPLRLTFRDPVCIVAADVEVCDLPR